MTTGSVGIEAAVGAVGDKTGWAAGGDGDGSGEGGGGWSGSGGGMDK